MRRDVADLVKEECASVCLLELADMIRMGVCKCTFHMAEEFALEKSLCNCPRIHAYHRSESPVRHPVDLTSQHILSGTVLTGNKHSRICSGYLLDSLSYTAHRRSFAPEHLHGRRRDHGFFLLASPVVCRLQRFNQLVIIPRLYDEVECSSLHSLYRQLDVSVCCK